MRKILSLAFPLIISQLIAMALVLTDVWMMSRLSMSALAAGGLGAAIFSFVFIVASSTVGCVANLVAIAYGQRVARPEFGNQQIRYAIKGAVLLAVILSALLVSCFSFAPHLLRVAQQPEQVIAPAMQYVNALKWTMLPALLLLILRGLTSAFGNVRSILVMSVANILLNIPISYLLAFKFNLGLSGLGAGTALSSLIVMLGYGYWVFNRAEFTEFAPWKNLNEYSLSLVTPLLAMGLPIGIAALLEHGLIYGGTLMAGTVGVAALALHQILLQCLSFTWNINFGFSQAAAILVGQDYGAENYSGIRQTAMRSFAITTVISIVLAGGFILWPEFIAAIFNLDGQLTELLTSVLWVVALAFVVDAWQLLAINLLRGMKIVLAPTVMTAIGYWAFGIPAAWLLLKQYQLGGIWAGIGIGLAVTGILLLAQLIVSIKKQMLQPLPA
ncbi:MATE family efflux transporter [Vibrio panuliri]|uniref:MATE family efflux transporter n=1 Tax=Vibrio panuliri TaxID=1381081 RepID=A0ABX3FN14_9VIBR|nr:MATE family efflux transporter [Vibrio panuliri]KAB1454675.1 MATE family efflux transporter [Vibrio panuliri]OLQ94138.1 MATE family efflux transporter [Vibrio panuliri]